MTRDEHREALEQWLNNPGVFDYQESAVVEALYTFSELGLLEELSVDSELGIKIWAIVERARSDGFPDALRV